MGLPKVVITIGNGALGKVAGTGDGVSGLVTSGTAISVGSGASGLALGVPVQLFSWAQFLSIGFTAVNNPIAYADVKDFYNQAGDGSELWLMMVSDATLLAAICNNATVGTSVKTLLDAAAGRIRLLGVNRKIPASGYAPAYTLLGGVDDDCVTAISNLEATRAIYAAAYKPFRAFICGQGYVTTTPGTLSLKAGTSRGVQVLLGSSAVKMVQVGIVLGRYAAIPVQRSGARVKDGALGIASACFPDGVAVNAMEASWDANIDGKGYVFFRNFYGLSGFYISNDITATADSDDYNTIQNGRVMDKAAVIAYATMVNELNDDIDVDPTTGYLSAGIIASWQAELENALDQNMSDNLSAPSIVTINPAQNLLSSNTIAVIVKLVPKGYSKEIDIALGFSNPFKTT